jgi:hypothetical protein
VPRAKYIKPPGSFPPIEQVECSNFRFRSDQWRELSKLLPRALASLRAPSEYVDEAARAPRVPGWTLKTIADLVVQMTEEAIISYLTACPLIAEGRINPANNRAAIRRLRKALEPFTRGWVDDETAGIIPADVDERLAARERELAALHLPRAPRRTLMRLCTTIRSIVTNHASANRAPISDQHLLKYTDLALTYARIKHPDLAKHRDRFAALVFAKGGR